MIPELVVTLGLPIVSCVLSGLAPTLLLCRKQTWAMMASATALTLASLGSVWFLHNNELIKSFVVVCLGSGVVSFGLVAAIILKETQRHKAYVYVMFIGISAVPAGALVGAIIGYFAGETWPCYFASGVVTNVESAKLVVARRVGVLMGNAIGIGTGLLVCVAVVAGDRVTRYFHMARRNQGEGKPAT